MDRLKNKKLLIFLKLYKIYENLQKKLEKIT